jgi:ABC-2 type transport system ATP-binding protein
MNLSAQRDPDPLVTVSGLRVSYGSVEALKGISLELAPGHIVALVGPNGAGKTTFFRSLFGELPKQDGTVRICGLDPFTLKDRRKIWTVARWVPDTPRLYDELTVMEFLEFAARCYRVPGSMILPLVADLTMNLGLADDLGRRIKSLSFGNQRKVHIAAGFLSGASGPRVLVLDEPYIGLDPSARLVLSQVLRQYVNPSGSGSERTIMISSHSLAELSSVADHAVMIAAGSIAAAGPISELAASYSHELSYEMTLFDEQAERLADILARSFEIPCRVLGKRSLVVRCADADAVQHVVRFLGRPDSPFRLRELKEEFSPLERVFLEGMEKVE